MGIGDAFGGGAKLEYLFECSKCKSNVSREQDCNGQNWIFESRYQAESLWKQLAIEQVLVHPPSIDGDLTDETELNWLNSDAHHNLHNAHIY